MTVNQGEVLALCGENGAGKSTLIKVLGGVHMPTSGTLYWNGQKVSIKSPLDAQKLGIGVVHQDFPLAMHLTVKENIEMGKLPLRKFGFINWSALTEKVEKICETYNIPLDLNAIVGELPIAQRQLVAIVKAIAIDAKIVILDEPTSSLTTEETKKLFELIHNLKEKGTSIIYISHYLEEVMQIADRYTILRDGCVVATLEKEGTTIDDIIHAMVGRTISDSDRAYYQHDISDQVVLRVEDLSVEKAVDHVSFSLRKGEILGIGGLVGAGRSEVLHAIFGSMRSSGKIYIDGKEVHIREIQDAMRLGIGLVPEDRKLEGLLANLSIRQNATVSSFPAFVRAGFVNAKKEDSLCSQYVKMLRVKCSGNDQKIRNLSGGNQQKVIFARWVMHDPRILLLDEPTCGVDVNAKEEIYKIIHSMVDRGISVIMVSSDLPELLRMSDRVLVMAKGRITGEADHEDATQEWFMRKAVDVE